MLCKRVLLGHWALLNHSLEQGWQEKTHSLGSMLKLLVGILALQGGYVHGDKTKEGTRVILGGEWFRETETGELNG